MSEGNRIHPIYFDSEINGDFTESGLPYRIFDEAAGLDLMLTIHMAGVFQYRVVNGVLLDTFEEAEGFLRRNLINSLPGVLADSEGRFGLPRELPAHAKEIGDALVSRLSWTWTDRFGVVLEQFAVTDCHLTAQSKAQLERALAALHADDALRDRLGLERKQKPEPPKQNAQKQNAQRPHAQQTNPQRPNGTQTQQPNGQAHNPQEEIQQEIHQVVTKIVSSWKEALEKSKSAMEGGVIPPKPPGAQSGAAATWRCMHCGNFNRGRFCSNCGARRSWVCPRCGKRNISNYCMSCGTKEP